MLTFLQLIHHVCKLLYNYVEQWKNAHRQKVRRCKKEVTKIKIKPGQSHETYHKCHSSKHTANQTAKAHHHRETNESCHKHVHDSSSYQKAKIYEFMEKIFDLTDYDDDYDE